jgi:hypothetical protein
MERKKGRDEDERIGRDNADKHKDEDGKINRDYGKQIEDEDERIHKRRGSYDHDVRMGSTKGRRQ